MSTNIIRQGCLGTPNGRTPPNGSHDGDATRCAARLGGDYVLRNANGEPKTDGQTRRAIDRIYDHAGLEDRDGGWQVLRHSFGTHAALFGVNPWTLMRWRGHKRIDETTLYVNWPTPTGASSPRNAWQPARSKPIPIDASWPSPWWHPEDGRSWKWWQ